MSVQRLRVSALRLRVSVGRLRVFVWRLKVSVGRLRVSVGRLRVSVRVSAGRLRVSVGRLRVSAWRLRVSVEIESVYIWEVQSVGLGSSECLSVSTGGSEFLLGRLKICVAGTEYFHRYSECLHGRIRVSTLKTQSAFNDQPIFKVFECTHCLLFSMLTLLPSKCDWLIMLFQSKSCCRC